MWHLWSGGTLLRLFWVGLGRRECSRWKLIGADEYTVYKSPMQELHKSNDFSFLVRVKITESPLLWFQ